ncbi:MAG: nitroreductase family deazaflavin-dependent oxidoreductase [Microlunatus sp.]|nr:nitroreductase family deazaflavin-dependent oxidoreductase [Microlunatus sp.]
MGALTPLALRIGSVSWLPRLLPQITWIDRRLQGLTGGRVGLLTFAGVPNLLLIVAGRSSGVIRTTPLLCVPEDGSWLVAGSAFGAPADPAWVGNLRAARNARVRVRGRELPVTAEELGGEERAAAWSLMLRTWPNYALYEQRTDRLIPVIRLTPM